jgi:MFS family permease
MKKLSTRAKILVLLTGLIPEAILESTLIPLYPFIVRFLMPNEIDVGHYAGLLGSAFYFPLFLMNLVWGAASDRFGRKPILLLGIFVSLPTTLLLGISDSYWLTLACRIIAGTFGANSTVAKGMIGDMARDSRVRAWAYAMYGSVYGLSGFLGPFLGGLLSNPADLYPQWFSKEGLFGKHPFLLICIFCFILSLTGFLGTLFFLSENDREDYQEVIVEENEEMILPTRLSESSIDETIGSIAFRKNTARNDQQETTPIHPAHVLDSPTEVHFQFFTWNTLGPIFLYCTIAYTNMTYMTALPLFFSTPKERGGLGLNSRDTAMYFSIIAGTKLFVQFLLFDRVLLYMGSAKKTFEWGMLLYIPGHVLTPFQVYFSGFIGFLSNFFVMSTFGTCESLGYLSVILMITESQQPQHLGLAHGLASTLAALARTLSPAITGVIWEWGVELHWNWLVFVVGGGMALMGAIAAQ